MYYSDEYIYATNLKKTQKIQCKQVLVTIKILEYIERKIQIEIKPNK